MNVTAVPEQIVVAEAAMETSAVTTGFAVKVIALLVTIVVAGQTALLVSSQLTISPVVKPALLYVLLFVPTGDPFSIH